MAAMSGTSAKSRCCMSACMAVPRSIGLKAARFAVRRKRGTSQSCPPAPAPTAGAKDGRTSSSGKFSRLSSVTLVFAWICSVPLLSYVQLRTASTYDERVPGGSGSPLRMAESSASAALSSSLRDVRTSTFSIRTANRAFSSLHSRSSMPSTPSINACPSGCRISARAIQSR